MDNTEREKLEKELELINRLEKFKGGFLTVYKFNDPDYDPNLYYLEHGGRGYTQAEIDEMKQYYKGIIVSKVTLVTRENVHLYRNRI